MRNVPVQILSAVDSASQTSAAFFTGQVYAASFTAVFGDVTAAGTLKIQGSNELPIGNPSEYLPSVGSFADIPNATSVVAAGVGPAIIIPSLPFQYIKAVYTRTGGGTTTITVNMTGFYV